MAAVCVHFVRNLLATVPKGAREAIAAVVGTPSLRSRITPQRGRSCGKWPPVPYPYVILSAGVVRSRTAHDLIILR